MPHKNITVWQWLLLVASAPSEAVKVFLALAAGELARWLLGERTRFRYVVGDFISCVLIYCAIRPFIPLFPPLYGLRVSPDLVVLVIALLGAHGVKAMISAVVKKLFGIDLRGVSNDEDKR